MVVGRYDKDDELIAEVVATRRAQWKAWIPDQVMVVLGLGSRVERELNVEACLTDGVPVFKRNGGGCAVVIDPGQVIVSAVLPVEGLTGNRHYFRLLTDWVISGLERVGIGGVERAGTSDLAVGDRKVGGACIHRTNNYLYYSTTLLATPAVELMERYLKHPPREPEYRRGRRHRDFVVGVATVKPGLTARQLKDAITNCELGITNQELRIKGVNDDPQD